MNDETKNKLEQITHLAGEILSEQYFSRHTATAAEQLIRTELENIIKLHGDIKQEPEFTHISDFAYIMNIKQYIKLLQIHSKIFLKNYEAACRNGYAEQFSTITVPITKDKKEHILEPKDRRFILSVYNNRMTPIIDEHLNGCYPVQPAIADAVKNNKLSVQQLQTITKQMMEVKVINRENGYRYTSITRNGKTEDASEETLYCVFPKENSLRMAMDTETVLEPDEITTELSDMLSEYIMDGFKPMEKILSENIGFIQTVKINSTEKGE